MARGWLFDLDGVVADTAEFHYRAWQTLADRHGLPFDRDMNEQLKGVSRTESLTAILDGREVSERDFAAMLKEKNDAYLAALENLGERDILPGMATLLDELKATGHPIAIASASRNAAALLRRLGLLDHFDAVSDGYSVARSKPAPDVFLHAAGQLHIPSSDALVVEDALAGIEGARAAGMSCLSVGRHLRDAGADFHVDGTEHIDWRAIEAELEKA